MSSADARLRAALELWESSIEDVVPEDDRTSLAATAAVLLEWIHGQTDPARDRDLGDLPRAGTGAVRHAVIPLPAKLAAVLVSLEAIEKSIRDRFDETAYVPGSTPEDMVDQFGRPILADVVVAQAHALVALAAIERA